MIASWRYIIKNSLRAIDYVKYLIFWIKVVLSPLSNKNPTCNEPPILKNRDGNFAFLFWIQTICKLRCAIWNCSFCVDYLKFKKHVDETAVIFFFERQNRNQSMWQSMYKGLTTQLYHVICIPSQDEKYNEPCQLPCGSYINIRMYIFAHIIDKTKRVFINKKTKRTFIWR